MTNKKSNKISHTVFMWEDFGCLRLSLCTVHFHWQFTPTRKGNEEGSQEPSMLSELSTKYIYCKQEQGVKRTDKGGKHTGQGRNEWSQEREAKLGREKKHLARKNWNYKTTTRAKTRVETTLYERSKEQQPLLSFIPTRDSKDLFIFDQQQKLMRENDQKKTYSFAHLHGNYR